MLKVDLSIVIPTYNEAKRIGPTLDKLAKFLHKFKPTVEVIIVDLDSPDGTQEIAKQYKNRFARFQALSAGPRPKGKFLKGKQVQQGVFAAHGRYVMFMDADLATPLKYLNAVAALMEQGKPVGICVRDLQKTHTGIRKFVSGFGNFLVQLLLLPGIKDTQCGFKVFERNAAREIFARQTIVSWGFDMEVLAVARKLGYRIDLIEVPDWHDITAGSKIGGSSAVKAALQTFPDLLKIRWQLLRGKYNQAKS